MRVLVTGATGFVGRHLCPALEAAGYDVRCATRNPEAARVRTPQHRWVGLDVEDPGSIEAGLEGCDVAFYLVHGMGQGADYPQREARNARNFALAAETARVRRVVYLGGVLPAGGRTSRHLGSRQKTGELLRSADLSVVETRAAMIIGAGSASWTMVRDLAARLPAMILPRWLRNHSYPISIDDVIWGLLAAGQLRSETSHILELPGPERISHRDVLRRVAALLGHRRPMVNVPILSPRLSSYWIALVTRVNLELARELVEGVRYDLEPRGDVLWTHVGRQPMDLEAAATLALHDERAADSSSTLRRMQEIGRQFRDRAPWNLDDGSVRRSTGRDGPNRPPDLP